MQTKYGKIETVDQAHTGCNNAFKTLEKAKEKCVQDIYLGLKSLMEFYPEIEEVSWIQRSDNYDDQSYYFSIASISARIAEDYVEKSEISDCVIYGILYDYFYDEPQNDRIIIVLEKFVHLLENNLENLKSTFGKDVDVEVTKDGIEIKKLKVREQK